jgi:hypothetical protein
MKIHYKGEEDEDLSWKRLIRIWNLGWYYSPMVLEG